MAKPGAVAQNNTIRAISAIASPCVRARASAPRTRRPNVVAGSAGGARDVEASTIAAVLVSYAAGQGTESMLALVTL